MLHGALHRCNSVLGMFCVPSNVAAAGDSSGDVNVRLEGTKLANNSEEFANLVADRRGNVASKPYIFSEIEMDICILNGTERSAANYGCDSYQLLLCTCASPAVAEWWNTTRVSFPLDTKALSNTGYILVLMLAPPYYSPSCHVSQLVNDAPQR